VPVSGKVGYEDGSLIPAEKIRIKFLSQAPVTDPKRHPRMGIAAADGKTGTFDSATTYVYKDGIIRGEHKVLIEAIGGGDIQGELVPAEYLDPGKTPLTINTDQLPLELKVRKPNPQ